MISDNNFSGTEIDLKAMNEAETGFPNIPRHLWNHC
jgi:hypothetical protein